jgi:hypothetical protein
MKYQVQVHVLWMNVFWEFKFEFRNP